MVSVIDDEAWMREAIHLALHAEEEGEVPVGAILVLDNKRIAQGWNRPVLTHDPTAHAEIQVLQDAGKALGNYRLPEATLYVTLEPCTMCAGAMIHARIKRLVFGAYDPGTGTIESVDQIFDRPHHNHKVEYRGGVLQDECSGLLKSFFEKRRNK